MVSTFNWCSAIWPSGSLTPIPGVYYISHFYIVSLSIKRVLVGMPGTPGDDPVTNCVSHYRKQSSSSFSSCSTSSELQSLPLTKRVVSSSSTSLNNSSPRLTKTPRKSSSRQTELADIQSDVESDQPQPRPQPSEVRRPGGPSQARSEYSNTPIYTSSSHIYHSNHPVLLSTQESWAFLNFKNIS